MKFGNKYLNLTLSSIDDIHKILESGRYNLNDDEKTILIHLCKEIQKVSNSIYFNVATFGDSKYHLTIRKNLHKENYTIKFAIYQNNNISGVWI